MAEVVLFLPRLVEKHINAINVLLKEGKIKEAEEYLSALPINIRVKINASFKKRYATTN